MEANQKVVDTQGRKHYVGQIMQSRTGTRYQIQKDGSWRRITAKKSKKRDKKGVRGFI